MEILYFILICVVVFLFVVVIFNFQNIKSALKNRSTKIKEEKQKLDPDTTVKKENLGYDEKEFKNKYEGKKVIDNLNREDLVEEPFVNITEDELDELNGDRKKSEGRKSRVEEKKPSQSYSFDDFDSFFDDFEEDEEDDGLDDLHDMYDETEESEISKEIKNLSPELKAILISNVLNKKDDI